MLILLNAGTFTCLFLVVQMQQWQSWECIDRVSFVFLKSVKSVKAKSLLWRCAAEGRGVHPLGVLSVTEATASTAVRNEKRLQKKYRSRQAYAFQIISDHFSGATASFLTEGPWVFVWIFWWIWWCCFVLAFAAGEAGNFWIWGTATSASKEARLQGRCKLNWSVRTAWK